MCMAAVFVGLVCLHDRAEAFVHKVSVGPELFLTPFIESGKISLAKKLSRVGRLPGANVASYSGLLTVDGKSNSNLFFWFVPALESPRTAPILLWLQGGPGLSSLPGLFRENGPYIVKPDLKTALRNTTWTKKFSIVYIDNPVGAGFSFTEKDEGYSTSIIEVGKNLFAALQQFFTLFSEYAANDFYVAGESMAGKFVPATAYTIHRNRGIAKMKLAGILIGDGLCDPETMMDYGDVLEAWGLIGSRQASHFRKEEQMIRDAVAKNDTLNAYFLWAQLIDADNIKFPVTHFNNATGYKKPYNLQRSGSHSKPKYYQDFLELPAVRRAIHVGHRLYGGGSIVHAHLRGAIMTSAKPWIAELIEYYKVLIFDGQLDLLVPYPLVKNFVNSIPWSGQKDLATVERIIWRDPRTGLPAGYVRQVRNFTEVLVRNAGHAVARDQPELAFDLVDRFINNKTFN